MSVELSAEDLAHLTDSDVAAIGRRQSWLDRARAKQIPPPGEWTQLLWMAGRGFGKTSSEVEFAWWEGWRTGQPLNICAVAPTLGDLNRVLFEGPAGFQAVVPPECLAGGSWDQAYNKNDHLLILGNGTKIQGFGATDGGARLRGVNSHLGVGDELREWDRPPGNLEFVHSNLMLGMRLPMPDGSIGRACFGTTPKNIPYLKMLQRQRGVRVIRGTTYENLANLAKSFSDTILSKEGTKIGKQEIYAQDSDGDEEAIFKRRWIRLWPAGKKLPEFMFTLMSMDTAFEEENIDPKGQKEPDYSACSVWGVFNLRQCFTDKELREFGVKQKYAAVLCDFWMERYAFPDLLEAARKSFRTKYGSPGKVPDLVLIEKAASGISLRQTLLTYGVPTWPFNPRGQSKTMRAHAASPLVLQGMMFMPESRLDERAGQVCDWAEPLLDQMTTFSGEGSIEFDDGLDSAVQAMLHLSEKGYFHAEPQGRQYPDADEKEEREQKEAQRIASRSQHKENPYGA